jgi:PleD family two-component response regulator
VNRVACRCCFHNRTPSQRESKDAETSGPVTSRRILVVDDDADTVASMAMLLELEDHVIRSATSAKSALAVVESFISDVAPAT